MASTKPKKDVAEKDWKRVDAVIWAHLGSKSARELAEMAGVPPEDILLRKRALLDEVDVLTIEESRMVLMSKATEILNNALDRSKKVIDERNYAPMLTASTGALKIVLQQLKDAEARDSGAVDQLNALRVRELLRLIDRTVVLSVADVAARWDVPENEMLEIFQTRLLEAATEMELEAAD